MVSELIFDTGNSSKIYTIQKNIYLHIYTCIYIISIGSAKRQAVVIISNGSKTVKFGILHEKLQQKRGLCKNFCVSGKTQKIRNSWIWTKWKIEPTKILNQAKSWTKQNLVFVHKDLVLAKFWQLRCMIRAYNCSWPWSRIFTA